MRKFLSYRQYGPFYGGVAGMDLAVNNERSI